MLRTLGLVLLGAALLGPRAQGQATVKPPSPQLQAELLRVRQAVWLAWFKGDRRALAELLPADLIAINGDSQEWEHQPDALRSAEAFLSQGGKLIKLEFPTTEFQVYGDVAVLYSRYTVDFEIEGHTFTQSGRATEIFRRAKGRWLNTGWHLDRGPAEGT
jgi:hypothetical protein